MWLSQCKHAKRYMRALNCHGKYVWIFIVYSYFFKHMTIIIFRLLQHFAKMHARYSFEVKYISKNMYLCWCHVVREPYKYSKRLEKFRLARKPIESLHSYVIHANEKSTCYHGCPNTYRWNFKMFANFFGTYFSSRHFSSALYAWTNFLNCIVSKLITQNVCNIAKNYKMIKLFETKILKLKLSIVIFMFGRYKVILSSKTSTITFAGNGYKKTSLGNMVFMKNININTNSFMKSNAIF